MCFFETIMNIDLDTFEPLLRRSIQRELMILESLTLKIGDEVIITNKDLCNVKPYGKILDKLDNFSKDELENHNGWRSDYDMFSDEIFKTTMQKILELKDLEKKKKENYIFVIKLHPSYKILPIIYDDLNFNYKLELCKKLLSFAKLYNCRLSNTRIGFELESVGKLFSYHKKDILLVKSKYRENFHKTTSYMYLVTNNAYKYTSHKTKLICIACNWKGIFKGHGCADFEITDVCTLICPYCKNDAVLEDKYDEIQIKKWHMEGGFHHCGFKII